MSNTKQPEEFSHPLPAIVNLHNSIFQDIQVHPLQPNLPHPVSDYRHLKISHSPACGILADKHRYQWAAATLWCICCNAFFRQYCLNSICHALQQHISKFMPLCIVRLFQIIAICHDHSLHISQMHFLSLSQ